MQVQIDLGNLAVGIGTAGIALVTLWVTRSTISLTRKQKIADFRIIWMAELRNKFSALYKNQYELAFVKRDILRKKSAQEKTALREKRRNLFLEIASIKVHILTMIKQHSDDADERELEKLLKRPVSEDQKEAKSSRHQMRELTRAILHKEWKRIRKDIEG